MVWVLVEMPVPVLVVEERMPVRVLENVTRSRLYGCPHRRRRILPCTVRCWALRESESSEMSRTWMNVQCREVGVRWTLGILRVLPPRTRVYWFESSLP